MASEGAIIPQLVESITQSSSTCSVPVAGGDISSSTLTTNIPCQTEVVLDEKTKKELFTDTFCRVCGAVLQFESHRNAHYEGKRHAQKVRLYFLNKELEEMAYKRKVDLKVERINSQVDQQLAQDKNKFCALCNMVFSSPVVAQSHYVGKIHSKKLRLLLGEPSESKGELSDSSLTNPDEAAFPPVGEDSVTSTLSEQSNQQEASTAPSSADNEIDLSDPNKYCKLCCASFNNPLVAQQHYKGKKHARNELRRKLMEEMEETGHPVDSGGDGVYVCPICSITLTSIEMYQSHMQGNKHQIKENIVAHLMKSTKKSYDSFENELEDYIKVQKARGLVPKTQFRPDKDQDSAEETEPAPMHPNPNPNPAAYRYFGHKAMPYPPYNHLHPGDPRKAGWEQTYWPPKPPRMPIKPGPPRKHLPSSPDTTDSSSSDSSSNSSHKKEKRHKREHRSKERKHHSKSKRQSESSERKKRKVEEMDSGKEDTEKKSEASGDKSKHKKEKKEKLSTEKESKKHKKPKKVEDQRTEEEMLWDESILGF